MTTYALGSVVTLSTQVKVNGVLRDPTTLALTIELPDGTTVGPFTWAASQIVRDAEGLFHYDYAPPTDGHFPYRFVSTGTAAGADEGEFDVAPAFGLAGIVTLADVRAATNLPTTAADDEIRPLIFAATEAIENLCGPMLRRTVTEKIRGVCSASRVMLSTFPILSVTSMTTARYGTTSATYTTADLDPDLVEGSVGVTAGTRLTGDVTVTYVVGRTSIPYMARKTALDLVQSWWENGQQAPAGGPILTPDNAEADFTDVRVPGGVPKWAVDQLEQAGLLLAPAVG